MDKDKSVKSEYVECLVTNLIKEYIYEMKNPRNDGWVQGGYREKLKKIKEVLENAGI